MKSTIRGFATIHAVNDTLEAAGTILYRVGPGGPEFLLLRSASHGSWGFPKGLLEPGEGAREGAAREVLEETGLVPRALHPGFRETARYSVAGPTGPCSKTVTYFLAETQGQERRSPEHDDHRWLDAPRAQELLAFENLRSLLARALAALWSARPDLRPPLDERTLDEEEARTLLLSLGSRADRWVRHSLEVSRVARILGAALHGKGRDADARFLGCAGLLHDAGRALDHDLHGWEGYGLMASLGLARCARMSAVHWLRGRDAAELRADGFRDEARIASMAAAGLFGPPSTEEKALCVADALVAGDRLTTLEERFAAARARYGDGPWLRRNETRSRSWLEEIEARIGAPVAPLLAAAGSGGPVP